MAPSARSTVTPEGVGLPAKEDFKGSDPARQVQRRRTCRAGKPQGTENDNPAGDALTAGLPKCSAPVRHQRALPHGEVAGALATVCESAAWTGLKLVFEFLVLTAPHNMRATYLHATV